MLPSDMSLADRTRRGSTAPDMQPPPQPASTVTSPDTSTDNPPIRHSESRSTVTSNTGSNARRMTPSELLFIPVTSNARMESLLPQENAVTPSLSTENTSPEALPPTLSESSLAITISYPQVKGSDAESATLRSYLGGKLVRYNQTIKEAMAACSLQEPELEMLRIGLRQLLSLHCQKKFVDCGHGLKLLHWRYNAWRKEYAARKANPCYQRRTHNPSNTPPFPRSAHLYRRVLACVTRMAGHDDSMKQLVSRYRDDKKLQKLHDELSLLHYILDESQRSDTDMADSLLAECEERYGLWRLRLRAWVAEKQAFHKARNSDQLHEPARPRASINTMPQSPFPDDLVFSCTWRIFNCTEATKKLVTWYKGDKELELLRVRTSELDVLLNKFFRNTDDPETAKSLLVECETGLRNWDRTIVAYSKQLKARRARISDQPREPAGPLTSIDSMPRKPWHKRWESCQNKIARSEYYMEKCIIAIGKNDTGLENLRVQAEMLRETMNEALSYSDEEVEKKIAECERGQQEWNRGLAAWNKERGFLSTERHVAFETKDYDQPPEPANFEAAVIPSEECLSKDSCFDYCTKTITEAVDGVSLLIDVCGKKGPELENFRGRAKKLQLLLLEGRKFDDERAKRWLTEWRLELQKWRNDLRAFVCKSPWHGEWENMGLFYRLVLKGVKLCYGESCPNLTVPLSAGCPPGSAQSQTMPTPWETRVAWCNATITEHEERFFLIKEKYDPEWEGLRFSLADLRTVLKEAVQYSKRKEGDHKAKFRVTECEAGLELWRQRFLVYMQRKFAELKVMSGGKVNNCYPKGNYIHPYVFNR